MATVVIIEERKLTAEEVKNRIFKQLETSLEEASAKEARRRAAWQAEEEERRRRIRAEATESNDEVHKKTEELKTKTQEELMHVVNYASAVAQEEHARKERELAIVHDEVANDVVREVTRAEVLIAEAQERRRRMEEGSIDPLLSDLHEKVQQDFMSHVSRKEVAVLEEEERRRRIAEDQKIEERQDFQDKVERNFNYLKTLLAEETERNRRILEEIGDPFSDEVLREVSRRQTWLEEEKERARRIFEEDQCDVDSAVERIINHDLVIKLEEEERQRRIKEEAELKKQLHEHKVHPETPEVVPTIAQTMEFPSAVQEEFMSVVSRMVSGRAQEKERDRRIISEEIDAEIRSESDRFLTWVLEERERRRRVFVDIMADYEDLMERRVLKEQVVALEEQERERRIRAEKTHKAMHEHADHPEKLSKAEKQTLAAEAQNEKVKEEFMSVVDRKLASAAEEDERKRRIVEEAILEIREEEREKIASRLSRIATKRLEEKERDRRLHEEMEKDFQEKVEREMQRRAVIALEEEERARRIAERTKKAAPAATITVQNK